MSDISKILKATQQFEQFRFDVEQKALRVLDPCKVAQHLVAKGVTAVNETEVLLHLVEVFLSQFPTFVDRVVLDSTAIPPKLMLPMPIRKKQYKIKGEIWGSHKNDADPFPSSPHAHNYDQNLVMHLGNGKLFRKREYICTAQRKAFCNYSPKNT